MSSGRDQYVWDTLRLLATFQFEPSAVECLSRAKIVIGPRAEVLRCRGSAVLIPTDVPAPLRPALTWHVPFGRTRLTLWNPLEHPGPGWSPMPAAGAPLWWRHASGALTPAWNLWANIHDLLTFREDRDIGARDGHDRLPAEASPRWALHLLDVPAANDANAALLDAVLSLEDGSPPRLSLPERMVRPVGIVLSHDCDQLRGNDVYTQGIRLLRAATLLPRGRWRQAARHLRAIIQNVIDPYRFFVGNLRGMLYLERQFAFRSVNYFLTGVGGRYGARSGSDAALAAAQALPAGWEAGVHYNYHTMRSPSELKREMDFVRSARSGDQVIAGRAHYLRFNPLTSPALLEQHGIRYDESVGWPGQLSYKAGAAGPFRFYDAGANRVLDLLEMPMVCMDSTLAAAGGMDRFEAMYAHLRYVGGMMSVLFHPGTLFNPEHPEFDGLYHRVLSRFFVDGGRSWTPSEIIDAASHFVSTPINL